MLSTNRLLLYEMILFSSEEERLFYYLLQELQVLKQTCHLHHHLYYSHLWYDCKLHNMIFLHHHRAADLGQTWHLKSIEVDGRRVFGGPSFSGAILLIASQWKRSSWLFVWMIHSTLFVLRSIVTIYATACLNSRGNVLERVEKLRSVFFGHLNSLFGIKVRVVDR